MNAIIMHTFASFYHGPSIPSASCTRWPLSLLIFSLYTYSSRLRLSICPSLYMSLSLCLSVWVSVWCYSRVYGPRAMWCRLAHVYQQSVLTPQSTSSLETFLFKTVNIKYLRCMRWKAGQDYIPKTLVLFYLKWVLLFYKVYYMIWCSCTSLKCIF